MSSRVSGVTYAHPNKQTLFTQLNFTVEAADKVAIVGHNGVGKSTLLKLIAGRLQPTEGSIVCASIPYYVPQHTGRLHCSVAEALGVAAKLAALRAIEQGSVAEADYDMVGNDWDIEARCRAALDYWQLPHVALNTAMDNLSGGEKTKVYLAGIAIHSPGIILLDEPTNHLDSASREQLYRYIAQSSATIVVVSHDIALLNQLPATFELSETGVKRYGGNYTFYKGLKDAAMNALNEDIHEYEKQLRLVRKKAQEVKQRQERRASQGEKNKAQSGMARIVANALGNSAENTAAKLKDKHAEIIGDTQEQLSELRRQREQLATLKIDFDNTKLHAGKLLVEATGINYSYDGQPLLWKIPIDFKLFSNDRIHLLGNNGAGKSTLVKLLTGSLVPAVGEVRRAAFNWIYLDQDHAQVDVDDTVVQLAGKYNVNNLAESEVKIRLNRFVFPREVWDKPCRSLSGGERMRLYLCCLMISAQTPDLIILDEPTNNLDIASLHVLTQTIKSYRGSLLVISHDSYFINEIGITGKLFLPY